MNLQEALVQTGLTGYEARIYTALLEQGEMTGYEAAKASGISRSNVYLALEGLIEKGGVCKIDGDVVKYCAVPAAEYCANKERIFREVLACIRSSAPERKAAAESYLTVSGDGRIIDKMKNMVQAAEMRIYVSQAEQVCRLIAGELEDAVRRGLRVVVVTTKPFSLDGAEIYYTAGNEGQVRIITDSSFVLTGSLHTDRSPGSCLYTSNETLITLFKEALRNEIDLIKLRTEGKA